MHTCPDCGQACTCNGDIDDLLWGEDSQESAKCTHYLECEADADDPDGFYDDYAGEAELEAYELGATKKARE